MSGKHIRARQERAEKTPPREMTAEEKKALMIKRLAWTVVGMGVITVACASLFSKAFPAGHHSVIPGISTMGLWCVWLLYVFKIRKF